MEQITESQKLLSAMDVVDNGILMGKQKYSDVQRVKAILPDHYEVKESKSSSSIHCKSPIGIRQSPYLNQSTGTMVTDAEDEEHWGYIVGAIKKYFGERFQEIDHNTWFCHVDFTIYFRNLHP